jgi:hypothetical protein
MQPSRYTVRFPSTGAAGVTQTRVFASSKEATRFATSRRAYLRRAYGPRLAAQVTVDAPEPHR